MDNYVASMAGLFGGAKPGIGSPPRALRVGDDDCAVSPKDVVSFASDRLLSQHEGHKLVVVNLPAPLLEPEEVLARWPSVDRTVWRPAAGTWTVSSGVAATVNLSGPDRFEQLRRWADDLWNRLEVATYPALEVPPPSVLGGLAYRHGANDETPWREHGDGSFTFPEFAYFRNGNKAWIATAAGTPTARERVETLARLYSPWGAAQGSAVRGDGAHCESVQHLPLRRWTEMLDAASAEILQGNLEKVVLARRTVARFSANLVPSAILSRLVQRYPNCTSFSVQRGRATFLGATPERLIRREGRGVTSEAIAGSRSGREPNASRALAASGKDLREHGLVVRAIADTLSPYCDELEIAPEPKVRELPGILHLVTPVTGRLRSNTHVIDLVEALHPTPALGGVPADRARAWISRHEPCSRGWYGGPIGWFDAQGDGEFVVGIRSGLVAGNKAFLYAGAGIVHGSQPAAEYVETELKLQPLWNALSQVP